MFKSEYSRATNHPSVNHLVHIFWNEIIFACITEKYMEFDLNDNGEIGKIAPVLKPWNIFIYC